MATTGSTGWRPGYTDAIMLLLVGHELVIGAAMRVAGLPGSATFLWAVGTGLALGYAVVWIVVRLVSKRWDGRATLAAALLVAMLAAIVLGTYLIGDVAGTLLIAALLVSDFANNGRIPAESS